MSSVEQQLIETRRQAAGPMLAVWSLVGAFGAYFCTYVFRKPFTAALYSGGSVWGIEEKAVLVTAQTLGYMAAKVVGIRVIAETPPERRALGILILVGSAETALLLFGLAPSPLHVLCLFANGLSLGLVFGLVIGFLEGRRSTEALAAGLCASFILADGVAKSIGTWLLGRGIDERWMPGVAGLLFFPPLLFFVGVLARIPPPDDRDVALRGKRSAMGSGDRAALVRRHGFGLLMLVAAYFLVTIARSLRADFAPEVWRALGIDAAPSTFASSEILVALLVLVANGLSVLILDNRRAFFTAIGVALAGGLLMLVALVGQRQSWLDGFTFMVLLGTGLYLPYVAIHTTIFERLIAMTRGRSNLGFLMYVADSAGYLGYAGLMLAKGALPTGRSFMGFFSATCGIVAVLTCLSLAMSWGYFARRGDEK
ncbi:MAG: DUF5690 family protein [Paludisphaera borealis]|uniref:DUF5690 family protein n=1 Tax=Paludisphaera borealis TaxID=1387353 RepID=UPI00284AB3F6|nr:DUF5690 family protein [Paludisphaera borealis]MDR3621396.1 DUF5690 family protein [Paludisphaera borealis]